jgi:photosystem II stability/assembly factor-like uncharacterized protein
MRPIIVFALSLSACSLAVADWKHLGPTYEAGKAMTYQCLNHPQKPYECLASVRPLGIMLTEDGGQTWRATTKPFDAAGNTGPNQESLSRAPSWPDTVYAGIEKRGVLRSDDGGRTWRDLSQTLPKGRARNGVSTAIHPTDPETAWLGTDGGLFKTTDGGRTWRRLTHGLPTGKTKTSPDISQTISKIIVDPSAPEKLWMGVYATGLDEPAGVWHSNDGGETWACSSAGIDTGTTETSSVPIQRDWIMSLAQSTSHPKVLYASTPLHLYRSDDAAATWQKLPHETGASAITVHPADPHRLYIASAGGGVKVSLDAGKTWADTGTSLPTGRIAGADDFKVKFKMPDGSIKLLDGAPKCYFHQIHSFNWLSETKPTLRCAATSGVYELQP